MTQLPSEPIEGTGVRLRTLRDDDIPDIAVACGDPEIQRFLDLLPQPYGIEEATWWVRIGAPAGWAAGGAQYAIADPVTDSLLGTIGLSLASRERGQAEIGYWVAPWARGRGVATAATVGLSGWAFGHGFGRLELLVHPENAASQRVAIGAGYRYESLRRAAVRGRSGDRRDVTAWVRLADDPPGPSRRILPDLPGGRLTDGVVTVRPLAMSDIEQAYRHRRLPDVVATTVPPIAPEREDIRRRCARAASYWLTGQRADMVIADATSGRYAGEIGLYMENPVTGQAMIGYSVMPEWRGRGFAGRAALLVARWAFSQVRVARLTAGADVDNVPSQRVLEKAGFQFEARERGRLPGPDGTRHDTLLYALLPDDLGSDPGPR